MIDQLKILDEALIRKFHDLGVHQIDYWDIRCGVTTGTTVDFTDQKSKEISSYESCECGIRTFTNGGWGFVVLKDLKEKTLLNRFEKAVKLAKLSASLTKTKFVIKERDPLKKDYHILGKKPLDEVGIDEKVDLVKHHEKTAVEYSPKVRNTRSMYFDTLTHMLFLNSFGSRIYQDLSVARMFSAVYAFEEGVIQRSINSVGGLGGYEIMETSKADKISTKSAKEAVELLKAKSPKGGKFTVIMDPKLTGTFVHEAFGHAVEADHILNKESILEGKIGKQVAQENISIIDNPVMNLGAKYGLEYEFFGSYYVDDEGVPSQHTDIIKNGILKNYLHSLETASRMGVEPNGHGRAGGLSSKPQVRMGITLLEAGDWSLDEMIADTKEGVYCEDFQYGYTDPTTGNFQFKTSLSYKIEKGEKKELMRDVALSGMTLEVLNRVSAIGKEVSFSDGMCGKGGQRVRVCDGGPYIRVKDTTIGGLG